MMTNFVAPRIAEIRSQLPGTVRLIAVSKGISVEMMKWAYDAGVRDFGESRVPEAIAKQQALADLPDICWHLIGHLQTNKVRRALQTFQWIHSVDSLRLLQQINRIASELACHPSLCLQVKVLPDPNKHGWSIPELWQDLTEIEDCQQGHIRGLMAIAPLGLDTSQTSDLFAELRQVRDQIQAKQRNHWQLTELSMGMSEDYPLAVANGATMVRLGSIIFAPGKPEIT